MRRSFSPGSRRRMFHLSSPLLLFITARRELQLALLRPPPRRSPPPPPPPPANHPLAMASPCEHHVPYTLLGALLSGGGPTPPRAAAPPSSGLRGRAPTRCCGRPSSPSRGCSSSASPRCSASGPSAPASPARPPSPPTLASPPVTSPVGFRRPPPPSSLLFPVRASSGWFGGSSGGYGCGATVELDLARVRRLRRVELLGIWPSLFMLARVSVGTVRLGGTLPQFDSRFSNSSSSSCYASDLSTVIWESVLILIN